MLMGCGFGKKGFRAIGVDMWNQFFAICHWWIWGWRNDYIFNSKDFELDSKVFIVSKYL